MARALTTQVVLRDAMHFTATTGSDHAIELDSPAGGQGAGPSPMELVLTGLASCSAMDVISILRKKRQPVQGLEVRASGERVDDYPMVYRAITLEFVVYGDGVDPQAVERSIELSRDRYCPVWAMLGKTAAITSSFRIESPVATPAE